MVSGTNTTMRRRWRVAQALLGATLLIGLVACAPGSGASKHAPTTAAHAQAAQRLGPTDPNRTLTLAFPLRQRASAALAALLAAINEPGSPSYHHYLTAQQYAAAYGPDQAERAQAGAALTALGLTVADANSGADLLQATGSAGHIASIFGVRLSDYRAPDGSRYIAADTTPHLPAALAAVVSGVVGLNTRPVVQRRNAQIAQPVGGGLDPSALRAAYNTTPLSAKGLDGSGQTIAVAEIDRFRQSDIQFYDSAFSLSAGPVEIIPVAGGSSKLSPEPVLDIEVLHAIAPKAKVLVYESGADLGSLTSMFDRIVSDNRAQVVSISLGACELGIDNASAPGFLNSLDSDFQRADAQGMSVLVSSGDSGAYGCQDNHLSVSLPASNPYVTAVGGTALFVNTANTYGYEAGWEGPLEGSGGGGGVSVLYPRPSWQTGPGVNNSFSNGMRQIPDISADADPLTGYRVYYTGGNDCSGSDCWTVVGGTSAAAPFWAGLIALANQQGNRKLGFLNPALYEIGQAGASGATFGGAAPFHDVTAGGNLYYQATPGWDYATGWGSPDAAAIVAALLAR